MKRQCIYVPADAQVDGGFVPSVVTENEPGHSPLAGRDEFAAPWVWGPTYKDAERAADAYNAKLGLSKNDVFEIIASSMRQGRVGA